MALAKAPASPPNPVKAPTADVPREILRDQWKRPLIVMPNGEVQALTRASTLGGVLEDQTGLGIWRQRAMVWITARDRAIRLAAATIATLDALEDKKALGELVRQAEDKADLDAAARSGTAMHSIADRNDRGQPIPDLGDEQPALDAYRDMIRHFEVHAIEQFVVCPELRCAGTFDRLLSPRHPLALEDGTVLVPGDRVIDDLKTSSTADYFGIKFCVQETVYARGTPYRGWVDRDELARLGYDREMPIEEMQSLPGKVKVAITRGEYRPWPDGIAPRQDIGLIMHVPSGGSTAELHAVDLTEGWTLAHLANTVLGWRKRKDLVVPVDLTLAGIRAATTREECLALYEQHRDAWTDEHTAAVKTQLARMAVPA